MLIQKNIKKSYLRLDIVLQILINYQNQTFSVAANADLPASIHVIVGNKTPTIAENIHITTAIINALSHPILYNPLKASNHAIPPIVADNKPLPSKKCAIP